MTSLGLTSCLTEHAVLSSHDIHCTVLYLTALHCTVLYYSLGLVVSCQNERSQHVNKATALSIMRSRLLQLGRERASDMKAKTTVGTGEPSTREREREREIVHGCCSVTAASLIQS